MFEIMKVGERISNKYVGSEGVITNINSTGIHVFIYMKNINNRELEQMKNNKKLKIGIFERNNIIFFLYKFGDLNWMDSPYIANLSEEIKVKLEDIYDDKLGYKMNIVIIETITGEVKELRTVALNNRLSLSIKKAIDKQMEEVGVTKEEYRMRVNQNFMAYTTKQMVDMAKGIISIN